MDSWPGLVVHADWGTPENKRWMARAVLGASGRYLVYAPEPVGEPITWLARLRAAAGPDGVVLLGLDFPIGLPLAYARLVEVADFLAVLPELGQGRWASFYEVATRPDEISLYRPFYPQRPGGTRQAHLLAGLGLATIDELRRQCERARPGRRAAAPLFWTLGGQQVGKAAIAGWREVLAPALRRPELDLAMWPFAGPLADLLRPGRVVVAECYPAEFYDHLGVLFSHRSGGKRAPAARAANARPLLNWAEEAGVALHPALVAQLLAGFGPAPAGEDTFDAVIGLLGMLNVLLGRRPPGELPAGPARQVEGWILGQSLAL
ncbi:MAG: hypothetical protein L0332_03755 [Chloroflexi bacterium]|nr:hypothetical protein [Chloroflexota bacterium]MCI0577653.1 hypothetical protein [Chloroflexota bacterium]MCI0644870.1 hypothetical protein [Chloroflexota bacterium]MCI0725826.1 hypothetical protein [Chloroflexota bacterium]